MTMSGVAAGRLSLSRVAQQTFTLVGADFARLFLVSAGVMALPSILATWRAQHFIATGAVAGANVFARFMGPGFWFSIILSLVAGAFLYGALTWEAVEGVQGRRPPLGEMLAAGARATPVLIGVGLLAYLGIVVGTICLVVPGVFLALAWSLTAPVVSVEKRGVFGAFGRSFELTRNNRWAILLIVIVYVIGCLLLSLLIGAMTRMALGLTGSPFVLHPVAGPAIWVSMVVNLLVGSLLRVVGATGLGVVYSELRGLRGGFDTRSLQEVFA